MRLMKLFNFKYLIQNLKKSKGVLAIFLGLIPILNFAIFISRTLGSNSTKIFTLTEISAISLVGAFIIPVILSSCLFGYLFKRKSVDFIGSMPIDRKTIFITNTIGGIGLIIILNLLNIVILSIVANVFNGFLLPFSMALDYFVLWTVIYSFIFIVTNLAISVSGNLLTSIVITCLCLFLIPFLSDYAFLKQQQKDYGYYKVKCTEKECMPKHYYCVDDECTNNLKNNIYQTYINKKENHSNHIAPYSFISSLFISVYDYSEYDASILNFVSIIKMLIGSICCFGLGLLAFNKRKMEVCETSFDNLIIHNVVKSLVLIPIYCIMLEIIADEFFAAIIFIAIIIIYYLVYDVITMRKISLKRSAIFTFLGMTVLIILSLAGINYFINNQEEEIIDVNNIDSVAVTFDNEYLSDKIYIEDEYLIKYIMSLELENDDYKTEEEEEEEEIIYYSFKIGNKEYYSHSWINPKSYNYIIDYLNRNTAYLTEFRKINDNVGAIMLGYNVTKDTKEIVDVIKKDLENISLKEYIEAFKNESLPIELKLVSYQNHKILYRGIPVGLSIELQNKIAEVETKALIKSLNKNIDIINELYIFSNTEIVLEDLKLDNNDIIIDYLLDYSRSEILDFIKTQQNTKFDLNKEHINLEIYVKNDTYHFITNNVEGIKKILSSKHQQLLNTPEYNDLLNNRESDIEYYD
ncbi:MAG: hypothetical protein IJN03_01165 [Bacilli bacterium]|nr:hypothetical protein [Bacilli bacterium]